MRHSLDEKDRRIAAALVASPRISWRELGRVLDLSERTVIRRATTLYADGTLRATAVRNPALVAGMVPIALRIGCRPTKIRQIAQALSQRGDTVWVDILASGNEISAVFFLDNPESRNNLLLRDLPATEAVESWTVHTLLRVFPTAFRWTAGLLTAHEYAELVPVHPATEPAAYRAHSLDMALTDELVADGRASYVELADRVGTTPLTVRRRLEAMLDAQILRLATEVDLALLGAQAEALLWIAMPPATLNPVAEQLSGHPLVRFCAATTGPANLLVAVATADLDALYTFLTDTAGPLESARSIDITPLLASVKRTGLIRH
ncbi:Lrp/AsnC family transcriptional regulator [Sinomonas sp. ASV322]|uniref:Lrp/AsnC family transcriptional regulator n=1 Tax=Sinomonas sp. ASV322 TaxID=3041920 RepID=UPI0027DC1A6B|nr:Lrp/AsnC family transcriptional regulator [Sinomonas sp. ASV322]MDQ4503294.1 Lrp/AsnC family transcriptional regulator [Sinomonas sp. ASV322]